MDSAGSGGATAVTRTSTYSVRANLRASLLPLLLFGTLGCAPVLAQTGMYQQAFPVSVAEAKTAVQTVSATAKGRLPTLEGFVQPSDQPIDRYEKGYYECTFQISAADGGGTAIRATAKITAWYNDPDAARSGYRVLISNGRLEGDALDRVAEKLSPNVPNGIPGTASGTNRLTAPVPKIAPSGGQPPSGGPAISTHLSSAGSTIAAASKAPLSVASPPNVPPDPKAALSPEASAESTKAQQAANEQKSLELSSYIKNLEEIQRNQSHPADLAAVKKSKTPVFAKASEAAQVLLNADAQDEFPILGVDGAWVHVQISGLSRGWIRRAQLEMPADPSVAAPTSSEGHLGNSAIFKVTKEETRAFSGGWEPLKGKPVRIEWVEPANPAISTSKNEKLAFAKSVFLEAYERVHNSPQAAEGIVVVFDSADGGQIEAALSSVKSLASRALSDADFWRQCSLDPRESFLESSKP
jgi:hypothetical protein